MSEIIRVAVVVVMIALELDNLAESLDQVHGHPDVSAHDLAADRATGLCEHASLERDQGDGQVCFDTTLCRFPGVGVESRRDVERDDGRAGIAERVAELQQGGDIRSKRALETGAKDGINDDGGLGEGGGKRGESGLGLLRVEWLDRDSHPLGDGQIGQGVAGKAILRPREDDAHAGADVRQVASRGEPVTSVVACAGQNQDGGPRFGCHDERGTDFGDGPAGVLHEEDRGHAILLDGEAVDLPAVFAGEKPIGMHMRVALARIVAESVLVRRGVGGMFVGHVPSVGAAILRAHCMVWLWIIAAYIGTGCSLALFVYWSFGLGRIWITSRHVPTARAGVAMAAARRPDEPLCVVVPAHNEAHAIGNVILTLRAQDHAAMSVVIALDRCTDGTAEVARGAIGGDPRFQVVEITHCLEGWAGKVHAVWSGVRASEPASRATYLLFIDADTELDARCISATAAMMRDRELDMLSLLSSLTYERWFETLAQPVASLELLRQYPLMQANRDEGRRPFANGQFMMFRASSYWAIETHESVKDELLEDLALARRISQAKMRAGVYVADGMMRCRMYESWAAFRKGWKRIFTEGTRRRPAKLRRAAFRVAFPGTVLPLMALVSVASGAVMSLVYGDEILGPIAAGMGVLGAAVFATALSLAYRAGGAPWWSVALYPAGAWLTSRILVEAARDLECGRPTEWGGMKYERARQ